MKVCDCQNFNPDFPERFPWGHLDSPKLASVASIIAAAAEKDLRGPGQRHLVPGLRLALNLIADIADV
jgi:hypothetical protein